MNAEYPREILPIRAKYFVIECSQNLRGYEILGKGLAGSYKFPYVAVPVPD